MIALNIINNIGNTYDVMFNWLKTIVVNIQPIKLITLDIKYQSNTLLERIQKKKKPIKMDIACIQFRAI